MPVANYGFVTGTLTGHADQSGGNPHHLLFLDAEGIRFTASVNLESSAAGGDPPELQFQIVDHIESSANEKARQIAALTNQGRFQLHPDLTLDFVRDGVLDMRAFQTLPRNSNPENNPFFQALTGAADRAQNEGASFVAVFGSAFPEKQTLHFSGVHNIHMNQGNFHQVGLNDAFFKENAPNQDGAVFFFFEDGQVQGFFSKFQSQDIETDANGNPVHTGVEGLDKIPLEIVNALMPQPPGVSFDFSPEISVPSPAFVFADPQPLSDPVRAFAEDSPDQLNNSAVLKRFAVQDVMEPVPAPRDGKLPRMTLAQVLGQSAVDAIAASNQIVFHSAGDTGAPTVAKSIDEIHVADLMVQDFADPATAPKFLFHLGDVVYFYGETEYYYDQFYKPFKAYPAPIFAIPGNHDGITYDDNMVTLAAFQKAFCDDRPSRWKAAGGIQRTTMTQPGVFFTLDAPFVSIIGLYSNCSETLGALDKQQILFLYSELIRLRPLRESGQVAAIIIAVHHPPVSFSTVKPSSTSMRKDMDNVCAQAGLWPDAVLSGHAHLYQRATRTVKLAEGVREIPYVVSGAGGYDVKAIGKDVFPLQNIDDPEFQLDRLLGQYGYLRLTVKTQKSPTLRIEFLSPQINLGQPSDSCVLDLTSHRLL